MFRLSKGARRRLERLLEPLTPLLFISLYPFALIPFSAISAISKALAWLWWLLPSRRKRIAKANLHLALGPEASEAVLRRAMETSIRNLLESVRFLHMAEDELRQRVRIEGLQGLREAREGGKGIVAVSCHLGNFPLLCMRLSLEGLRVGVVAKMPRNRPMARFFSRKMQELGLVFIDGGQRRRAAKEGLRHLREGGLLYLQLDQNPPYDEAMVPFFGHPVPTYRGPVVLAERTGAAVVPVFIVSEAPGRHVVMVERPYRPKGDLMQDLEALNGIIEAYIRRFPEQWWWWHRRWKKHLDYR